MRKVLLTILCMVSFNAYATNQSVNINDVKNRLNNRNSNINALVPISNTNNTINAETSTNITRNVDTRIPVSSVITSDIYPTATCLGASSMGGQGQYFGLGFATSKESRPCNVRQYVRDVEMLNTFKDLGINVAVLQLSLYCQDKLFKKALRDIGVNCPKAPKHTLIEFEYPSSHGR